MINGESLKERTNKPSSLSYKSPGEVKVKALPGSVNVKHAKSQITFSKYGFGTGVVHCNTGRTSVVKLSI